MIPLTLLLLLLPCLLGLLVAHWFSPNTSWALKLSLAPGIGIGIGSCTFFLSLLTFNQATSYSLLFDIALILIFAGLIWKSDIHKAAIKVSKNVTLTI